MSKSVIFGLLALGGLVSFAPDLRAEGAGAGRGGPFLFYHLKSLSAFDSALSGNPMIVGGKGMGQAGKNLRIGGAGGGGFAWGASSDLSFGLGYGGVQAEYSIASWLVAGILVGGGGYSISKKVSETDTTVVMQKLASGAFVLFYPSLQAEVKLRNGVTLAFHGGYFLPSDIRLHSIALGLNVLFGRL